MALATVDAEMQPSCRVVLLKGVDETGFVWRVWRRLLDGYLV